MATLTTTPRPTDGRTDGRTASQTERPTRRQRSVDGNSDNNGRGNGGKHSPPRKLDSTNENRYILAKVPIHSAPSQTPAISNSGRVIVRFFPSLLTSFAFFFLQPTPSSEVITESSLLPRCRRRCFLRLFSRCSPSLPPGHWQRKQQIHSRQVARPPARPTDRPNKRSTRRPSSSDLRLHPLTTLFHLTTEPTLVACELSNDVVSRRCTRPH